MSKYKTMKAMVAAMMAAMLLLPMAVWAQRETGDERTTGLFRQAMDLYQKQTIATRLSLSCSMQTSSMASEI